MIRNSISGAPYMVAGISFFLPEESVSVLEDKQIGSPISGRESLREGKDKEHSKSTSSHLHLGLALGQRNLVNE